VDETSPTPFVALMMLGFLIGCAGHLYKSPTTVAVGIAIAFLATAAAYAVYLT
jgi:biopolymer transport protein ExbB/TolQ